MHGVNVTGFLEMAGWSVIEATNGQEGCLLIAQEYPDLVILDVMMPIKDGLAAFKEMREDPSTSRIPVILLTAVNQFELGAHYDLESVGRQLGVPYLEGFLEKPVDSRALLKAVDDALSAH
ncbi:MAG: response regulator [Candidatus Hydrogenedentes bacterium]|nr:response regulator [Candidatus Hydrogenedentota bacterium]